MRCIAAAFFPTVLLLACARHNPPTHAKPPPGTVRVVAKQGVLLWAESRPCAVPADIAETVAEQMAANSAAFADRTARYNLTMTEESDTIRSTVYAYLDDVSMPTRIADSPCVVASQHLSVATVSVLARNPDTGFLDVDGRMPGAEIFIDGERKGIVRQMFVVSVGSHVWKTMGCEDRIVIAANETRRVRCDKD